MELVPLILPIEPLQSCVHLQPMSMVVLVRLLERPMLAIIQMMRKSEKEKEKQKEKRMK